MMVNVVTPQLGLFMGQIKGPSGRRSMYSSATAATATQPPTLSSLSPPLINLARGQPHSSLLPYDRLGGSSTSSSSSSLIKSARDSLQYGAKQGSPSLREALANLLTKEYFGSNDARGLTVDFNDIIITNGSSSGLDICLSTLVAHDGPHPPVVLVADPSYFLVFPFFSERGLRIVPVPCCPVSASAPAYLHTNRHLSHTEREPCHLIDS